MHDMKACMQAQAFDPCFGWFSSSPRPFRVIALARLRQVVVFDALHTAPLRIGTLSVDIL
jgi:hypothetical protein